MRVGDDPFFIITKDEVTTYTKDWRGVPIIKSRYKLSEVTRATCVRTYYGDELRLYHYNNVLAVGCPCAIDDLERVQKALEQYKK